MIMAEPARRNDFPEPDPRPAEASLPSPEEEMVLVKRARHGDLAAYDELVRRYQERIYATVYHMTANHEDANDLAQAQQALQCLPVAGAQPGLLGLTVYLARQTDALEAASERSSL